jgi:hypothetical protein
MRPFFMRPSFMCPSFLKPHISGPCFFILFALAYLASPYVALFQLEAALERGDTQALERGVDWKMVRDGLKQDIADGVIGPMQAQLASNTLPPFGSSFISGIMETSVDREVTPQNLVAVMHQMRAPEIESNPLKCFDWAFFESLVAFTVTVHNEDAEEGHLRLRMEMHGGKWVLVRAWVPQDLIERTSNRT